MTIGVAASGPDAGAAVRAAVLGAEVLGRGAIGGFAVFAVLDANGDVKHCVTQRGGIAQLAIPDEWLHATRAAVISSGPDRPEPLLQFLPGAKGVGLVTGHRLPNRLDASGIPLNQAVLSRIAAGDSPQCAIDLVLDGNPEADAGLIAVNADGLVGWGNSDRVKRRTDSRRFHRDQGGARIAILHNSICFPDGMADVVAELAWACLAGQSMSVRFLHLQPSVCIRASHRDRVCLARDGSIELIETANPHLPMANGRATAIYLGSEVWQDGRRIGRVISELMADVESGKVARPLEPTQAVVIMKKDEYVSP